VSDLFLSLSFSLRSEQVLRLDCLVVLSVNAVMHNHPRQLVPELAQTLPDVFDLVNDDLLE